MAQTQKSQTQGFQDQKYELKVTLADWEAHVRGFPYRVTKSKAG